MRSVTKLLFASAFALSAAAPVLADDAPAPPAPFTITGGATLISDYRFRGISQTNKRFAVQGTIGVSHESGLYASIWGSSIDDYVANGGDQEIDLVAGYKKTISGTTIDGGMLYYYYPGSHGANTDFFEPYLNVSHTLGPISGKLGLNYSWKQHALSCSLCSSSREDNLYTYGEAAFAVPNTGLTITGHLGETWGRSYLSDGLKNYTDWSVTAAYTWKALTFSAAYVDTDIKQAEGDVGTGRSPVKAGFVGAVAVAF
jgi:uncharacterized protein (TIGR02001 family)